MILCLRLCVRYVRLHNTTQKVFQAFKLAHALLQEKYVDMKICIVENILFKKVFLKNPVKLTMVTTRTSSVGTDQSQALPMIVNAVSFQVRLNEDLKNTGVKRGIHQKFTLPGRDRFSGQTQIKQSSQGLGPHMDAERALCAELEKKVYR